MRVVATLLVVSVIAGLSWIVLAEPPAGATTARKENAEVVSSWTFDKVWYRGANRPSLLKAFKKSGTLSVTEADLQFHAKDFDLRIPTASIRSVTVGPMKGDGFNHWAIVEYETEGDRFLVGFKDAKKMGHGTDTVAIRDAIQRVLDTDPSGEPEQAPLAEESAIGFGQTDQPMTWKQFRQEVKRGFPVAPKTLITDPSKVGVVLIDGDIKQGLSVYGIDGIGLVRTDDESHVYKGGPVGGRRFEGVAMFTGLDPGEYGVRIVRAAGLQGWIALEIPPHPDLTFQIEAGKVHYYGRFRIKGKRKSPIIEVRSDPTRESAILGRFAEKYSDSPWATAAGEGRDGG